MRELHKSFNEYMYQSSPILIQNFLVSSYGFYLKTKRRGGDFKKILQNLEKSRNFSADQLEEAQNEKLVRIIRHAYNYVPFYRDVFTSNKLTPDDIKSVHDLWKIPVLNKTDVQQNIQKLQATGNNQRIFIAQNTSGSSGTPLTILLDKYTYKMSMALLMNLENTLGIGPDDRRATFAGRMIQPADRIVPPFWRYNLAEHQMLFSSYHLNVQTIRDYLRALEVFNPKEMIGYPSSLSTLAMLAEEIGDSLKTYPSAVITNSETLLTWQREILERFFSCRVVDYYGTAECVVFGAQCQKNRYHMNPLFGICELVDEKNVLQDNGEGDLVCTSLVNYVMPLIRYRVGDRAIRLSEQPCNCGWDNFPILESISGRVDDILITPDGKRIGRLDHIFKGVTGITEAQIIQESSHTILIRVVKGNGYTEECARKLVENAAARVGREMNITVDYVSRLERRQNGKFPAVINRLLQDSTTA